MIHEKETRGRRESRMPYLVPYMFRKGASTAVIVQEHSIGGHAPWVSPTPPVSVGTVFNFGSYVCQNADTVPRCVPLFLEGYRQRMYVAGVASMYLLRGESGEGSADELAWFPASLFFTLPPCRM